MTDEDSQLDDAVDPALVDLAFVLTKSGQLQEDEQDDDYKEEDVRGVSSRDEATDQLPEMKKRSQLYSQGGWLLKRPDGTLMLSPRSVNWSSLRGIASIYTYIYIYMI